MRTAAEISRASPDAPWRCCNLCGAAAGREVFVKNGFSLLECPSCTLLYVGNPPSADDLKRLYSFDAGYHTTSPDDGSAEAAARRRAAREYYRVLSRFRASGSLLDVGCSSGFFLGVARDEGWETCGLEMSADTARVARERFGLNVMTGTLEETTFPEERFDAVTLWDVIEHVPDPVRTMSIVHRILKDDGIVAFVTPNVGGLFPRAAYAAARVIRYWPHPEPPHHLFQFSKRTARELATRTGFAVRRIVNKRIPLAYTFGRPSTVIRSPRQLLYTACFAPVAALGPLIGSGDAMLVVAQKVSAPGKQPVR
jgi:2-polyprenyl-3-methyl-5-hydroxy-6-metoxy-1,4-benzoquinol methylase